MTIKSATQKLDIRWQDRVWQPRIRRVPVARAKAVASATESPVSCRRARGGMGLIQSVFCSVVPRRDQ